MPLSSDRGGVACTVLRVSKHYERRCREPSTHFFGPEQRIPCFKHRSHSFVPSIHLQTLRMLRHARHGTFRGPLSFSGREWVDGASARASSGGLVEERGSNGALVLASGE